jgi:hypothetical protein
MVELAERMVVLANRLPGILKGDDRPGDNAERLVFAQMCFGTKRFAGAARLYAEALESDAGLVQDREARHRYRAACAAARAVAGRGQDDPAPDDGQKVKLRGQALAWLKAELAAWADSATPGSTQTRQDPFWMFQGWRSDGNLASVREPEALAKLPVAERKEWEALWAEVEAAIKRAAASGN